MNYLSDGSWGRVFETEACSGFVRPLADRGAQMRPVIAQRAARVSPLRRGVVLVLALAMQMLFAGVWLTSRHIEAPIRPPSLVMIDLPPQAAPVSHPVALAAPRLAAPEVVMPLPVLPQITPAPEMPPAPTAMTATVAVPAPAPNLAERYETVLMRHLNAHKRYPAAARARRQQGVVTLRFTMTRAGRVIARAIETSSRAAALDEEALMLLERAQPLPAPPATLAGAEIELVVPISFLLR